MNSFLKDPIGVEMIGVVIKIIIKFYLNNCIYKKYTKFELISQYSINDINNKWITRLLDQFKSFSRNGHYRLRFTSQLKT